MTYSFTDEIRAFLQEKKYLQNVSPETIILYETSFKRFRDCDTLRASRFVEKGLAGRSVKDELRANLIAKLQEMMERLEALLPEQMSQLVDQMVKKLVDDGGISPSDPNGTGGQGQGPEAPTRFQVTDKSLDFSVLRL